MYREKLNSMETCIPTALRNKKCSELSYPISFDKTIFNNMTVIGQVDKKFIAVIEERKQLIILFDQHAVHERIRLEELLEGIFLVRLLYVQHIYYLFKVWASNIFSS